MLRSQLRITGKDRTAENISSGNFENDPHLSALLPAWMRSRLDRPADVQLHYVGTSRGCKDPVVNTAICMILHLVGGVSLEKNKRCRNGIQTFAFCAGFNDSFTSKIPLSLTCRKYVLWTKSNRARIQLKTTFLPPFLYIHGINPVLKSGAFAHVSIRRPNQ